MPATQNSLDQAIGRYLALRTEYERVQALADAAFARWFTKLQAGESCNGAAVSRLENRANYLTADMESAAFPIWKAELDPDRLWDEHRAQAAS
jgi:hypothetical protein